MTSLEEKLSQEIPIIEPIINQEQIADVTEKETISCEQNFCHENSKLINDSKKNLDEIKNCPICLEILDNDLIVTPCQHEFHQNCLNSWINESNHSDCPLCRTDLSSLKKNHNIDLSNYRQTTDIDRLYRRNINQYINNNHLQYQLWQWNDRQAPQLNSFYGQRNRGPYQSNPYGLQTSLDYSPYPFQ